MNRFINTKKNISREKNKKKYEMVELTLRIMITWKKKERNFNLKGEAGYWLDI